MCGGKGAYDTWGKACELGHMHKKMDCPVCAGKCYIMAPETYSKCPKCDGLGGFDVWDKPCLKVAINHKRTCVVCNGACYQQGLEAAGGGSVEQAKTGAKALLNNVWDACTKKVFTVPSPAATPGEAIQPPYTAHVTGFQMVGDHAEYQITVSHPYHGTYIISRRFSAAHGLFENMRKAELTAAGFDTRNYRQRDEAPPQTALPKAPAKKMQMPAMFKAFGFGSSSNTHKLEKDRVIEIQKFLNEVQFMVTNPIYSSAIASFYAR